MAEQKRMTPEQLDNAEARWTWMDGCKRVGKCRDHPLALCQVGFGLLCAATKEETNGPQG